jgi:hypothetical protein
MQTAVLVQTALAPIECEHLEVMPEPGPAHLLPPAIRMTDDERRGYERESLEALRRLVEATNDYPSYFQEIQEARLVGEYPETKIVVRWLDKRDRTKWEQGYHLWISEVTQKPPGYFAYEAYGDRREPPNSVGLLIHTWIGES